MSNVLESEQIKEVYANYGLALYRAQVLEKNICILLSCLYHKPSCNRTRWQYEYLLDRDFESTLGNIAKKLKEVDGLPSDIEQKLTNAIASRNLLSHNYWWKRAIEFVSFQGREGMLAELCDYIKLFEELNEFIETIIVEKLPKTKEISEILNMNDDEMVSFLSNSIKTHNQIRRKLKREETLIKVYFYTFTEENGDVKETELLELSDHTFWSLGDSGLTYCPGYINHTNLRPALKFEKALPAKICPHPKGAADWNYRIPLNTGFYIEVSPVENEGAFAFKWGLRKSK